MLLKLPDGTTATTHDESLETDGSIRSNEVGVTDCEDLRNLSSAASIGHDVSSSISMQSSQSEMSSSGINLSNDVDSDGSGEQDRSPRPGTASQHTIFWLIINVYALQ